MKLKNKLIIIFLSLIIGSAVKAKPTIVNNDYLPINNVKKNIPDNIDKESSILDLIQSRYILAIFIPGFILPILIIFSVTSPSYGNIINIVNLTFKSLSLMVTVFLPVALIDSIYYSRRYRFPELNLRILKVQIASQMIGFYSLIMFGNIRYWLIELYNKTQVVTSCFLRKIDWLETIFIVLFAVSLIVALITSAMSKVKKSI